MKNIVTVLCLLLFSVLNINIYSQGTITDFDGNVYNTVTIGEQVWLKENLKSLHYSDGTEIPGVVAFENNDSLGKIYGLLYTWDAAMKNSTVPGSQGVCPCSCHLPTDQEWTLLENYLGGRSVAGGKMKEAGTEHWMSPNTGATNSSGFSGLPAGEFDAYYTPNKFWLLNKAAVFWTSTQTNQNQAQERYLSHDNAASGRLAWYKVMKYSIRCIKDTPTDVKTEQNRAGQYKVFQNYPNPFNPETTISYIIPEESFVTIKIYDILGNEISILVNEEKSPGMYNTTWNAKGMPSGVYICCFAAADFIKAQKLVLTK